MSVLDFNNSEQPLVDALQVNHPLPEGFIDMPAVQVIAVMVTNMHDSLSSTNPVRVNICADHR